MATEKVEKWIAKSKTIWGIALATVTSVFGALGPLIGLDISAGAWIAVDTAVIAAINGIGGLIGIGWAIYGRLFAEGKLFVVSPTK